MNLLPKVFRTEGDIVEFDPSKILNSIMKETGMDEEKAKHITELVVRRIISSGIQFLSGPHIREIVCSILSENRFENERKLYTRIGMPLMDYEKILEYGLKKGENKTLNPEKIHHWAANQLAEEYTLLRILNDEESEAHLYGDIYIHQLKYFDLRPYSQIWDPRIILQHGVPPIDKSLGFYKSAPPKSLDEAIYQLTNWFGIVQGEFCGSQVYDFFNLFLAPFAKGLDYKSIKSAIHSYYPQINYISMILGKNYLKSSICCSPKICESLENQPAVGSKGEFVGVYGDYKDECLNIFKAFIEVISQIKYNGVPQKWSLHRIYFKNEWLEQYRDLYKLIYDKISTNYNPILVNTSTEFYQSKLALLDSKNYINHGILQKISLNLPRIAYLAPDENSFMELLTEKQELCFNILKKKYNIIQKRISTNHLPFCSAKINDQSLYNFKLQDLSVGVVGLNEAVKMLTNYELHESDDALNVGKHIISVIHDSCIKRSKNENIPYSLIEDSSNTATKRFIRLDLKHFPKMAVSTKREGEKQIFYSNSTHFSKNSSLPIDDLLKIQGEFHKLIKNGAHEHIGLKQEKCDITTFEKFLKALEFANLATTINNIQFYI